MKEIHQTNWQLILKWLEDACRILNKQGTPYKPNDGGDIDKIYKAISALNKIKKTNPSENIPKSDHYQVGKQWVDFAYAELTEINARGDEYICSTTEALLKCNAIKRLFDGFSTPMYFRGEHYFGWDLIPRIGRTNTFDFTKEDSAKVTKLELELMNKFQLKVKGDSELKSKIFGDSPILNDDNPGWWSIMQHYDDESGTRMLDITSSIFCGLYFACIDWDGSIDDSMDGKLYMFPHALGRTDTESPDRHNGQLIGPEDEIRDQLIEYFSIEEHIDTPRFRKSPARNERVLSQDGLFAWQAKFNKPLNTFQIFPFRVHREFKKSIAEELSAMGYTRDRILSENRFKFG